MATIYLGRENVCSWRLGIGGGTAPANTITRAKFSLPPEASPTGEEEIFDTSDENNEALLVEDGTVLEIRAGFRDLVPRSTSYVAHITVFDSESVHGLAWALVPVVISSFRPETPTP